MNFKGDLLEHARGLLCLTHELNQKTPGAFERAADKLHVDPSVLRRRVQSLSAWVGGPLLQGRGTALELSTLGKQTAERCERLVAVASSFHEPSGETRVTVGCTGTIITELLPRALVDLERTSPQLRVAVKRLGSSACVKQLDEGAVDLGVIRGAGAPAGVNATRLCDDRLWLAAPRRHALLEGKLSLDALARASLVLYGERSQTRARVMAVLGPLGATVRFEVDGKASALEYVARGLGVSFLSLLPTHAVKHPGVVLREVTSSFPRSSFWLLRPAAGAPGAEVVARQLLKLARAQRGDG